MQHEQPHLAAVGHRQQRHDHVPQLLGRGGEQLVLGEAVEQRHHGLVIVGAGEQILPARDRVELAANDRDQAGRLARDLGREQPDHPQLADHASISRHPAHPDVVHPGGADGWWSPDWSWRSRPAGRRASAPRSAGGHLGQRHAGGVARPVGVGHDAQPRVGHHPEHRVVAFTDDLVLAVARDR